MVKEGNGGESDLICLQGLPLGQDSIAKENLLRMIEQESDGCGHPSDAAVERLSVGHSSCPKHR